MTSFPNTFFLFLYVIGVVFWQFTSCLSIFSFLCGIDIFEGFYVLIRLSQILQSNFKTFEAKILHTHYVIKFLLLIYYCNSMVSLFQKYQTCSFSFFVFFIFTALNELVHFRKWHCDAVIQLDFTLLIVLVIHILLITFVIVVSPAIW